ncbi:hypothetical protein EVAR_100607_1 [Eumeta japonica]|uniref:Uncharacterized protein n=1 Tax=Eumeta variegata TaxID=151549 RepID=A0A4C2ABX7_EUMVA|nr:hypothetical protein EVAR_100607_1 [Eumeta japonica]
MRTARKRPSLVRPLIGVSGASGANAWPLPLPAPGDLFITPAALHKIVIRLPKESPGPDGVSTAALRHLPRRAIVAMNRVFNGILRTGHFRRRKGENHNVTQSGKRLA